MKPTLLGLLKSDSSFPYSFPTQREKLGVSNNAFKSAPVCSPLCGFRATSTHYSTQGLPQNQHSPYWWYPPEDVKWFWCIYPKALIGELALSTQKDTDQQTHTTTYTHTQHQQPKFLFLLGNNTDQLPQGCLWSFHSDELIRTVMTDNDANNTFWVPLCKLYNTYSTLIEYVPHTQPDPCMNPRRLVRYNPHCAGTESVLGEVNVFARGHMPSKWRCRDLNLERLAPTPTFLNATPTTSSSKTLTKAILLKCL